MFKHIVAYNVCMETRAKHPALAWEQAARQPGQLLQTQLRLAAMTSHMQLDKIAARRTALIDLLADGRPHPREEIWETIAVQLGDENCWGKLPPEALARDLAALRQGVFASLTHVGQRYRDIISNTLLWHGRPPIPMNLSVGNSLRPCVSYPSQRKTNAPLPLPILLYAKNVSC